MKGVGLLRILKCILTSWLLIGEIHMFALDLIFFDVSTGCILDVVLPLLSCPS